MTYLKDKSVTPVQLVKDCEADAQRYWRGLHESMSEDLSFWDGEHYDQDADPHNRDRRQLLFVGQETFNVVRHKSAQVTSAPRSVEARPVDEETDAETAEIAVSIVEWETNHPQKMFDDCLDIAVTGALAAKMWGVIVEFDPDEGEWGEILFSSQDMRRVMWEPGFHSPHNLKCGWLLIKRRIPIPTIRSMKGWSKSVAAKVHPDSPTPNELASPTDPIFERGQRGVATEDDGCAEVWFYYCKDRSKHAKDAEYKPLPETERYMACQSCGWKSATQEQMPEPLPDLDEFDPALGVGGCPECGQPITRIDAAAKVQEALSYPKGQRLIIIAPNASVDDPLYDGGWPVPCRSFPIMVLSAYLHPTKPAGHSDTSLNWSAQLGVDILTTVAVQRILEARNYYMLPDAGVNDFQGNRFEFRDDQFNIMYYRDEFAPNGVQMLQGSTLDPSWQGVWGNLRDILLSHQGISDLGLTESSSKDIAARTVEQLNQMGEIPVEHLKRRVNRELGRFYGIVWDYIRHTYTAERLARLRMEGMDVVIQLSGDELPNFDFVLADNPPFTGLDEKKSQAVEKMMQLAVQAPDWMDIWAEANDVPRSIQRKFQKKREELQMQAQQMAMMAGPQGPPPEGVAGAVPAQ